jgi:hypothetical protein
LTIDGAIERHDAERATRERDLTPARADCLLACPQWP